MYFGDLKTVEGFENRFRSVIQSAITNNEPIPTGFQIITMRSGNSVNRKRKADLVTFPFPRISVPNNTTRHSTVYFGKDPGLIVAIIKSCTKENTRRTGYFLFEGKRYPIL